MSQADFNSAVQAYAKAFKPAAAKNRFAEIANAYVASGHTAAANWKAVGDIPADKYEEVAAWFAVAS